MFVCVHLVVSKHSSGMDLMVYLYPKPKSLPCRVRYGYAKYYLILFLTRPVTDMTLYIFISVFIIKYFITAVGIYRSIKIFYYAKFQYVATLARLK